MAQLCTIATVCKDCVSNNDSARFANAVACTKEQAESLFRSVMRVRNNVNFTRGDCGELKTFIEKLTTLPDNCKIYVPPLYDGNDVTNILFDIHRRITLRNSGKSVEKANAGCIFGGVEGTGKTYLARIVYIMALLIYDKVIPVWYEFPHISSVSKFPRFRDLVANAINLITKDDYVANQLRLESDGTKLVLLMLSSNYYPLVIFDEFQHVYYQQIDKSGEPLDKDEYGGSERSLLNSSIEFLVDFHAYCNVPGTFCLATGSSANLRDMMFPKKAFDNSWYRLGYPEFNGQLLSFHVIPALRTVATLAQFICKRFPRWRLNGSQLEQLYYITGGIGRHVAYIYDMSSASCSKNDISTFYICKLPRRKTTFDIQDSPHRQQILMLLACFIAANTSKLDDMENSSKNWKGISRTEILAMLSNAKISKASVFIAQLIQDGLLYENGNLLEVAVPYDMYEAQINEEIEARDLLLLMTVRLMVTGIYSGENERVVDVNAGYALESLIRPRVGLLFQVPCDNFNHTTIKIVDDNQMRYRLRGNDNSWAEWANVTIDTIDSLCNQMLIWHGETGLDGVVFRKIVDGKKTCYKIDGWQCKGGRYNVTISGGDMQTSIKNWKEAGHQVSVLDDTTLHGILVKAQIGLCKLGNALCYSLGVGGGDKKNIHVGELLITTTKLANAGARKLLANIDPMKIDKSVCNFYTVNTEMAKCKFKVTLKCGVGWVRDCLPHSLHISSAWFEECRPNIEDDDVDEINANVNRMCVIM